MLTYLSTADLAGLYLCCAALRTAIPAFVARAKSLVASGDQQLPFPGAERLAWRLVFKHAAALTRLKVCHVSEIDFGSVAVLVAHCHATLTQLDFPHRAEPYRSWLLSDAIAQCALRHLSLPYTSLTDPALLRERRWNMSTIESAEFDDHEHLRVDGLAEFPNLARLAISRLAYNSQWTQPMAVVVASLGKLTHLSVTLEYCSRSSLIWELPHVTHLDIDSTPMNTATFAAGLVEQAMAIRAPRLVEFSSAQYNDAGVALVLQGAPALRVLRCSVLYAATWDCGNVRQTLLERSRDRVCKPWRKVMWCIGRITAEDKFYAHSASYLVRAVAQALRRVEVLELPVLGLHGAVALHVLCMLPCLRELRVRQPLWNVFMQVRDERMPTSAVTGVAGRGGKATSAADILSTCADWDLSLSDRRADTLPTEKSEEVALGDAPGEALGEPVAEPAKPTRIDLSACAVASLTELQLPSLSTEVLALMRARSIPAAGSWGRLRGLVVDDAAAAAANDLELDLLLETFPNLLECELRLWRPPTVRIVDELPARTFPLTRLKLACVVGHFGGVLATVARLCPELVELELACHTLSFELGEWFRAADRLPRLRLLSFCVARSCDLGVREILRKTRPDLAVRLCSRIHSPRACTWQEF